MQADRYFKLRLMSIHILTLLHESQAIFQIWIFALAEPLIVAHFKQLLMLFLLEFWQLMGQPRQTDVILTCQCNI